MERRRRRRRQRRAEGAVEGEEGNGSSRAAAADAGDWEASEWGPAPPQPPVEETAWGWAADDQTGQPSFSEAGTGREDREGAAAWAEDVDRRARRRSGAAASTSSAAARDAEYEDEEEYADEDGGGFRSPRYEPGIGEPDIALLSPEELERVLPVVPFSAQAAFFNGGPAQAVQRWGASLALTVLLSKAALLAATSLTWPLWWPWAQAATKNYAMRKQMMYAGLWRTKVLDVEARGRPRPQFGAGSDDDGGATPPRFSTMRTTRILLGDPEGAQTELVLPHDARFSMVEPGQPAELIVLSTSPTFESFKAVKDVYLPDCGLWLSEYPFLDRTEFLEISLEIEREAAAGEMDDGGEGDEGYYAAGGQPPPPPPRW